MRNIRRYVYRNRASLGCGAPSFVRNDFRRNVLASSLVARVLTPPLEMSSIGKTIPGSRHAFLPGYLVFHSFFQLCSLRPKKRPVCATPPSPVPVPTSSSSRPPSPRPYPGRFIATVSFDGTCCVWRRQSPGEGGGGELSWELTATLEGHENEVRPEDQGGDRWGGRRDGVC